MNVVKKGQGPFPACVCACRKISEAIIMPNHERRQIKDIEHYHKFVRAIIVKFFDKLSNELTFFPMTAVRNQGAGHDLLLFDEAGSIPFARH